MKLEDAQHIIAAAKQDRRLDAELDERWTRWQKNAFHVKLTLRKFQTSIVVKAPGDWPLIKQLWEGL